MNPARVAALVDDALLDWRDVTGRWLGESAAAGWDPAPDEVRPCPFAGSRRGEPMNAGALAQVTAGWSGVLAALTACSGPTAAHAWRATCRLRWAPLWAGPPVAAPTAAAFKTALGLNRPLTSWLLLAPGAASRPLAALVPPDRVVARLEAEGWLHGQHQVCAGPPGHIEAAWAALCASRPPDPHPADDAALVVSALWAVLGATRRLLRDGVLHEVPGWSPVATPRADWPESARLLLARGPGALVREVPHFEPAWALHVWEAVPPPLAALVDRCERAPCLADLDAAWRDLLATTEGGCPS
ncbi:MAG: hypothetical protein H6737_02600 [Alphaproteobacteria bacterium]|nr:hypothetical protein [Alphaproteobacteria bacterium]